MAYLIVFDLSYNMRKGRENENEFSSVFQQDFFRYDGKGKAGVYKETETMDAIKGLYRETRTENETMKKRERLIRESDQVSPRSS